MNVFRLILPTPYPVGPVNSYLIKQRPYTLVDPGPDTEMAKESLKKQLAEVGVRLKEIERIVVTHGHLDHAGLAEWMKNTTGAVLYAHPYESRKMDNTFNPWVDRDELLIITGMPEEKVFELHNSCEPIPRTGLRPQDFTSLWGGETLNCGKDQLMVLHMPGHAVGHLCLFALNEKHLWAGDFLLPNITPNPIMEKDPGNRGKRANSLLQYLTGLNKLGKLDIQMVWPGHGDPFADAQAIIRQTRQAHEDRMKLILSVILPGERLTPYQITESVFPNLSGFNIYLGISEIMAHLDVLRVRHLLKVEEDGGVLVCQHTVPANSKTGAVAVRIK